MSPAIREFVPKLCTHHHSPYNLTPTTMPQDIDHEEKKVQDAIKLLENSDGMKIAEAARKTRCSYDRLRNRLNSIPPSSSYGGHNKKLTIVEDESLKDYLIIA
jgi:hypothetical protein